MQSMYEMAKERYAALGVDVERAMEKLRHAPVSLHCWQGDDVRGFDTDPTKPLTGGIQTTGNYPGRARTPEELHGRPGPGAQAVPRHQEAEPARLLRHFR